MGLNAHRRGFIVALSVGSLAAASGCGSGAAQSAPVVVQLLAINDFHGHLEPPDGTSGRIAGTLAGGAEYLATHIARATAGNPNSIVVAAGDIVGASPLLSAFFHDEPAIEAMNAMHLAVSAVGNHEFDEGANELLRMQSGSCHPVDGCQDGDGFAGAAFTYLSANVVDAGTRRPLFPATAVLTVGGVRIGFIGETLKGTAQIVVPSGIRGLEFLDEADTANRYAAELKQSGVNAIVLLIHEGGQQEPADVDVNGCRGFHGAIRPLLERLAPDIKVIISGHTHRVYNCVIDGRRVTSASSYGRALTHVTLAIDPASGSIERADATNEVVTRDVEKDPAQARIIAKYTPFVAAFGDRVAGSIAGDITRRATGAGESPMGDLVADAQLADSRATDKGAAVIAFMNPGGLRADLVAAHQAAGERPGELTYKELFGAQPFGNTLTVVSLTGEQIKRLLEQQFDNPTPGSTKILQVSEGFSYTFRLKALPGNHVDQASIRLNGVTIAPGERLRVEANNFIASGGDGFTVFGEGTDERDGGLDIDALVSYVRTHSPVPVTAPHRIIRRDAGGPQ